MRRTTGAIRPAFTIVGLPDKAIAESRERVRSALGALGLGLPPKRITINLAHADLAKDSGYFDLPIAPLHHLIILRSLWVEKGGVAWFGQSD